jgi:5-methylcytosine-specific restriction endonuclease McrA
MSQSDHRTEYGQKLHVHHLEKARNVDDSEDRNSMENLITLCRDCHNGYEKFTGALKPQYDGLEVEP